MIEKKVDDYSKYDKNCFDLTYFKREHFHEEFKASI